MGQRLNISMELNGEVVANAYYHWSAYTRDAAYIVNSICDIWHELEKESLSDLDFACRLLHETGAGFNEDEIERIRAQKDARVNTFPLWPAVNRNEGLISVTQKGIEETEFWEESRVAIDLRTGEIDFGVCFWTPAEEYRADYDDFDSLLCMNRDPTDGLTVDNFARFYESLEENSDYAFFIVEENAVLQLIE